jgi:hypothetical protein
MEQGEAWAAIDEQRRALVGLLESLSAEDWSQPSLCGGWTVRQVAAHLALQNTTWSAMPRAMADAVRYGGMNVIAEIRDRIGVHRPLPTVTFRETAIDYLVHGQDIAIPLRRVMAMSPELAMLAADRVWSTPRMFHARKKLSGYRLIADDTSWSAGQGQEVRGPIGALLLLLTGRPAALPQLSGPGTASLRESLALSAATG